MNRDEMMQTVFFDMDDTIYDRSLPFRKACELYFPPQFEQVYPAYLRVKARGDEVFLPSQRGEITMEEMYIFRICKGFSDVGITLNETEALQFQKIYREMQGRIELTPVMQKILELCKKRFPKCGLITNGPSEKQRAKIQKLGIEEFFRDELILVSGEVKVDKPDRRIYQLAQQKCGSNPENILYIGDSVSHDILPAMENGWRTIWFNRCSDRYPDNLPLPGKIVNSEEELYQFLQTANSGEKQ